MKKNILKSMWVGDVKDVPEKCKYALPILKESLPMKVIYNDVVTVSSLRHGKSSLADFLLHFHTLID